MLDVLGAPEHQSFVKKKKTTSLVGQQIGLKLSSAKTLELMMNGMLRSSSVTLSKIASGTHYHAQNESLQRRFSRFLAKIEFNSEQVIKTILSILRIKKKQKIQIAIDRTNWERGNQSINLLVVALIVDKTSIVLHAMPINEQKKGNSSFRQVGKILKIVSQALPTKRIEYLVGDREFGGFNRIKLYKKLGFSFSVRLKEQWHMRMDEDKSLRLLHTYFLDLKTGESRTLKNVRLGEKGDLICDVSAKKLKDDSLLIVAHSPDIKNPLDAYKQRWGIERLFFHCKIKGFRIEATGILHPERLLALMTVLSLVIAILISKAIAWVRHHPLKIKKHGHPSKSFFTLGLWLVLDALDRCRLSLIQIIDSSLLPFNSKFVG